MVSAQTNFSYFRSSENDIPNEPLVTVTLTASNVSCLTIEEDLPSPASAVSVSGDGVWLPALGVIRWGPYFNTAATNVSYRLTGPAGSYPINGGSWMDGERYVSPGVTMVPILPSSSPMPSPPPEVATPTFSPYNFGDFPVTVTLFCATPGATIYYTLDGSLPTTNSELYGGAMHITSASTVRTVGFVNGWLPSAAAVAFYGPPAPTANALVKRAVNTNSSGATVVTFTMTPGTNAECLTLAENLPPDLGAANVTAGGNYIASNDAVVWGPFFGTNVQTLSYQPAGLPGIYPVQASWSVDGIGGGEPSPTNIVISGVLAPSQVAAPVFTPPGGTNLPVSVTISCATPGATIYYTLDGTLPTQASILYSGAIYLTNATTIRAVAFANGWLPSVTSVANYVPPVAPQQVAEPVFTPPSGANAPVDVIISCATAGAAIYYTLDGTLPTQASILYTGAILVTNATTIWAVALTNGWTPSVTSVANYGPPAPTANAGLSGGGGTGGGGGAGVTLNVAPRPGASCIAVTESLPPGLAAINVSNGTYNAGNNSVLWGPFFGTNALALSFVAVGPPGTYSAQITWSVDGVSSETVATIVLTNSFSAAPTPPLQEPAPILSPVAGSSLPIQVSISSSDPQAQIYFTTDGTLPTQSSTPYTTPLTFNAPTTLRAVAFHPGYLPSVPALGYYVAALPTNSLSLVRSILGNGTVLPSVTLTATPMGSVSCYVVTETLVPGLTPTNLAADAVWNQVNNTISWGPYLDNQPRAPTYQLTGPPGTFPLLGQGSFDGYSAAATGVTTVSLNTGPIQLPPRTTNYACTSQPISYTVEIDHAPDVTVDSASGTLSWGDGTQTNITQPAETFQKLYFSEGTYTITVLVSWTGHTATNTVSGNGTTTDTIEVSSSCGPIITSQPTNEQVLAGATAQFTVGASSAYPLSYQWYFNETNALAAGGTSATLTLSNVTLNAAGSYSVLVANAYGSVTSSVATLTVTQSANVPPVITQQPASVTTNQGTTVVLSVAATGTAPLTYQWQFNGTNLPGADDSVIYFFNVLPYQGGTYTVTVSNAFGVAISSNAIVTIIVPPAVRTQPASVITTRGGSATFTVGATGSGPLNYQWQFDGTNIAGASGSSLSLPSTAATNIGYYSVIISNAAGTVTSGSASLTFLDLKMYAGLTITSPLATNYDLQAIPALGGTNWTTLTNVALGIEPYLYIDYNTPTNAVQFYRAIPQP